MNKEEHPLSKRAINTGPLRASLRGGELLRAQELAIPARLPATIKAVDSEKRLTLMESPSLKQIVVEPKLLDTDVKTIKNRDMLKQKKPTEQPINLNLKVNLAISNYQQLSNNQIHVNTQSVIVRPSPEMDGPNLRRASAVLLDKPPFTSEGPTPRDLKADLPNIHKTAIQSKTDKLPRLVSNIFLRNPETAKKNAPIVGLLRGSSAEQRRPVLGIRERRYYIDDLLDALGQNHILNVTEKLRIEHFAELIDRFASLATLNTHLAPHSFRTRFRLANFSPGFRQNRRLVVFDMDETLLHCSQQKLNAKAIALRPGRFEEVFLHLRPGLFQFLDALARQFTLILYTASHKTYADILLDELEHERRFFALRLYRHHCISSPEGSVLKDLSIIEDIDLRKTIFVDNSPACFFRNWQNAVPIIPYSGLSTDRELFKLQEFIERISGENDFRIPLDRCFKFRRLISEKSLDPHFFYSRQA